MTVQHMKTLRGNIHSYAERSSRSARITDDEMKLLTLQAVQGFLFVVSCDGGKIIYVSESVSKTLNYTQVYYYT